MTGKKKGSKEKEGKTCGYQMWGGKPCGRYLYDDEHCIFHSKDIERKKDKFNDAFWKEFERQKKDEIEYDYSGFVFPGDISFERKTFEKNVHFTDAQFFGFAEFEGARFYGVSDFAFATFSRAAIFEGAQFSDMADFGHDQFSEWANFKNARFSQSAEFERTLFSWDAEFEEAQFTGAAAFCGVEFSGMVFFIRAQFSGDADFFETKFSDWAHFGLAQFYGRAHFGFSQFNDRADFDDVQFSGMVDFCRSTFSGERLYGLFDSLRNSGIKRIVKGRYKIKDFRLHLNEKIAKKYPVIDRMVKDAWYLDDLKAIDPITYWIWWLFADCGRSFFRWALWSLGFAIVFAFIYYSFYTDYMLNFQTVYVSEDFPLFSFIYYSIVTFTTLGFGDIVPRTGWLQFWVMIEVILGYIMLGGLISILANKLARRS